MIIEYDKYQNVKEHNGFFLEKSRINASPADATAFSMFQDDSLFLAWYINCISLGYCNNQTYYFLNESLIMLAKFLISLSLISISQAAVKSRHSMVKNMNYY